MSYAQAAEMTLPQLLHALGTERQETSDAAISQQVTAAQFEMLDRIARRCRRLPIELAAMPIGDLVGQIRAESGVAPVAGMLAGVLLRYAAQRA